MYIAIRIADFDCSYTLEMLTFYNNKGKNIVTSFSIKFSIGKIRSSKVFDFFVKFR